MNEDFLEAPARWLRLQMIQHKVSTGDAPGGIALSATMASALAADVSLLPGVEPGTLVISEDPDAPDLFYGVPLIVVPETVLRGAPETVTPDEAATLREQLRRLPPASLAQSLLTWLAPGIPVVTSPMLPLVPSDGTNARRIVRHGMADVLKWLGEDVGPLPGEPTHAMMIGGSLYLSAAAYAELEAAIDRVERQ